MIELHKGDRARNVNGDVFSVMKRRKNKRTGVVMLTIEDGLKRQFEVNQVMLYPMPKAGDECIVIPAKYWEWRWSHVQQLKGEGQEWKAAKESRELEEQQRSPLSWELDRLVVRKVSGNMALVKGENFSSTLPLNCLAVLARPAVAKLEEVSA